MPKPREGLASARKLWILVTFATLVLVVAGIALWAWPRASPRTPEQREAAARELLAGVRVSANVVASSLVVTNAIADFGGPGGVRLVRVRIVDELHLALRVETSQDVVLAEPPRVCLIGPYSAPDDAGLSDRCWGEPDLGEVVAATLSTDGAGHPMLAARGPVMVDAVLRRGDVRCDYPAGKWLVEIAVNPLIDGSPVGAVALPDLVIELPYRETAPLPFHPFNQTRYCGLADAVYLEQGEPLVSSP